MGIFGDERKIRIINQSIFQISDVNERNPFMDIGLRFDVKDAFAEYFTYFSKCDMGQLLNPLMCQNRELAKVAIVNPKLLIVSFDFA